MERYGWWDEPGWRREEREREGRRAYEPWSSEWDRRRRYEGERYGERGEYGERYRPEVDPPWVERGPEARRRGVTRGLYEWEDRGPLEWLGDKARELTGRGRDTAERRWEERRLRGPKGYQRSDERIRDEVCERIARSGVDAEDVVVAVQDRMVTLDGTVRNRYDKWRLEQIADDVFGVEDVDDRLRIRRYGETERGAGTTPTDPRH